MRRYGARLVSLMSDIIAYASKSNDMPIIRKHYDMLYSQIEHGINRFIEEDVVRWHTNNTHKKKILGDNLINTVDGRREYYY